MKRPEAGRRPVAVLQALAKQPLTLGILLLAALSYWPLLSLLPASGTPWRLGRAFLLLVPIAAVVTAIRLGIGRIHPRPAPESPALAEEESEAAAEDLRRTAEAIAEVSARADARGNGRILLVDDNAVNRRVAKLMLARAGYRVDEARDGQEAIDLAVGGDYDLILMDVHMPRRDGVEATRAIRAAESPHERTPIVAMTARAPGADLQECLDAGMDDYVHKPVQGPALMAAVESWVDNTMDHDHTLVVDEEEAQGALPVLAPGALDELRSYGDGEDNSILLELADMFFRGAEEHIGVLREAYAAGDKFRFERAAHTLKGSSGTLGARRLAERCRQYEENARNGSLPASADEVEALVGMVADIRVALEKNLGFGIG